MPILEVDGLTKEFSGGKTRIPALQDVSLTVQRGEIVGLLGLNGAGKTTLIKCVLDLLHPTDGLIEILGFPSSSRRWRSKVGYLPEAFDPPGEMTVAQVLQFLRSLHKSSAKDRTATLVELLDLVGLPDHDKKVRSLSKGMRVRLGLAQALLGNPSLLILDEPTDSLDPGGVVMVRQLLMQLRSNGVSILLSSHLLSEVERVADRVVIMHKGRVINQGSAQELLPQTVKYRVETASPVYNAGNASFFRQGSVWAFETDSIDQLQTTLLELSLRRVEIASIETIRPSLEEAFFHSIGINHASEPVDR